MNFPSEPQTYLKAGKTFFFRLTFADIWKRNSSSPARRGDQHGEATSVIAGTILQKSEGSRLREISEEAPLREVRVLEKFGRIQIHDDREDSLVML